jgi:hypothetical protein
VSQEKRLHRRKLVNAKVMLIHPVIGEYQTYTHDISNGGVFVLLQKMPTLPAGTELEMRLLESGQPDYVFKMEIARVEKFGLGLKFLGFVKNGKLHSMDILRDEWKKQGVKKKA